MSKNLFKFAKRSMALSLAAIMTLSTASAAFAAEVDESIAPAVEAEAAESSVADESLEAAIDAEIAAVDEQASEEAVIEETVTIPEAEESGEEVTAEEETSGEGFEAGEYSEQIDSGAEDITDESAAEVTEEAEAAEAAESIEVAEEVTEEIVAADPVADEEAEAADGEKAEEVTEAEDEEITEELDDSMSAPILVGSIDAGLTSSLANVGGVTVNPGAYSPYFNSQTSGGVGAGTQQYTVTQNGKTYTAYCAEPEFVGVNAPSTRTAYEITDGSFSGWGANIKKAMYYTYGAPGGKGGNAAYDKLMAWVNADLVKQTNPPTTQANLAYAYSHVIVAKAFNDM
ncbi:MAG: hypothetical protein IKI12_02680, partial [Lachnospiraceae bacterium]|nr:hypothetical protein [Lachnospiraceae bacterium]